MRRIRSKGTKPELALFAILTEAKVPFETHSRVEGISVDALLDDRVAIFVDSPFWHLRDLGTLQRMSEPWQQKLLRNRRRDRTQTRLLRAEGYTVIRFWEDDLKGDRVLRRVRNAVSRARRRADC